MERAFIQRRSICRRTAALLAASTLFLSACAVVGPNYTRPAMRTPTVFKEIDGWKRAQPQDATPKGDWWRIYGDSTLDELLKRVNTSNQSIAQAEAQYRQARALVAVARASYFPTVQASGMLNRGNTSIAGAALSGVSTERQIGLDASWEPDFWGGIRRSVEANVATAQARAADLESTRLSMQAELAQDYFQLRALDSLQQVLDDTVAAFQKSLDLTNNRYRAGVAARSDVVQAQAQLKSAQAQATDVGVQRAQFEHAIAVLIGVAPAEYSLPRSPVTAEPPVVPAGVPSELLERRPDIASTERQVAAANAQIGVAEAAFYPTVNLTASLGAAFGHAFSAPTLLWSLGAAIAQTIFDGGARQGHKDQAIAAYDGTVANYRQTVLSAFQEVEDNLAALRILEQEAQEQASAVAASREAVTLALNQYKAGTVDYLNVLTTQQTALTNEKAAVNITSRRFVASVTLVRALGGGWNATKLPAGQQIVGSAR